MTYTKFERKILNVAQVVSTQQIGALTQTGTIVITTLEKRINAAALMTLISLQTPCVVVVEEEQEVGCSTMIYRQPYYFKTY